MKKCILIISVPIVLSLGAGAMAQPGPASTGRTDHRRLVKAHVLRLSKHHRRARRHHGTQRTHIVDTNHPKQPLRASKNHLGGPDRIGQRPLRNPAIKRPGRAGRGKGGLPR